MSTVEERVHLERATQGLPTPASAIGDDVVDARVAAAYRTTATVLASAMASPSHGPATVVEGDAIGAAPGPHATGAHPQGATRAAIAGQPSGSSAPARSKPTKQETVDADTTTASQSHAG
ncbi:MAG: hypothetical protein M3Q68_08585 [Actinomycetota bacterium]|nr:hypothetical protein [Actinomycetota bacterium]